MAKFVFETAMERIEEISCKLREEKLPFEEMIKLYEEGTKLSAQCEEYLTKAEFKLKMKEDNEDAV